MGSHFTVERTQVAVLNGTPVVRARNIVPCLRVPSNELFLCDTRQNASSARRATRTVATDSTHSASLDMAVIEPTRIVASVPVQSYST